VEKERLQCENDELRKDIARAKQLFAGEMKATEARHAADQEAFQKQMSDLLTQSQNNLDAMRQEIAEAKERYEQQANLLVRPFNSFLTLY